MRNLKRALSLALASVMLLGMMVVGTSASYADVSSKNNQEAIEVLQAVGVMVGDEKGNFNPDQKVTRNEMAVIMANLLDLKVDDFSAASIKFTDVPAWAAKYVAACKADGIIAGYSETVFGGSDTVTAAQAALMMQKALGYFQFQADFGDDWQLATVKQASKIDLFDGINAGAGTALTRNEVAQLALNALEATMVEADGNGGTTIKGDGFVITTGSTKYVDVLKSGTEYKAIKATKDGEKYTVELGEELYDGKLEKITGKHDDLGRPAHIWEYKNEEVITAADKADNVVVATEAYAGLMAAYIDKIDEDADKDYKVPDQSINGRSWTDKDKDEKGNYIQAGDVIEYFEDDDVITAAVVVRYDIGKIEDVSTKLTKAQKDDGATCKVKIDSNSYVLDTDFVDFDYEEGDYILYVQSGTKVLASQLAETVEGTVTTIKGEDVRIDGTYYKDLTKSIAVEDEGTFYLNVAGQIIKTDTTSKSDDYAYIYSVDEDQGKNSDGIDTTTFTAYVVLADGTKASYVVDTDEKDGKYYFADTKVEISESYKGVIAYSVNSDKELVYETAKDTIGTAKDMTVSKSEAAGTDSKTQFIFVYPDGSKMKVSTAVGYKNVNFTGSSYAVTNSDGDILYVFVTVKNGSVTTDAKLAVVLDAEAVEGKNGDDKTFTYAVAIDGEETELTFKGSKQDFEDGQVIAYEMDGDYAKIDDSADIYTVDAVATATDDYVKFSSDGKQYNLGGDETVYTITVEYEDEDAFKAGDIDTVTVSEGGKIEKGDQVAYTLDGTDLDVVFVYDFVY